MSSPVRPNTGLVIGKFYPPHRGHLELIRFASNQVKELRVLVCHSDRYSIPGQIRKQWLERIVPANTTVHLIEERYGDEDSEGWAKHTVEFLGFAPEKVFTSEEYGIPFSAFLGSTHVEFDVPRAAFPVSGTQVRAAPWLFWNDLSPPVRAHYAGRIAIIGSESCGKSTLAAALAQKYGTYWVPEYGRLYWEAKHFQADNWKEDDFIHIAQMQNRFEDEFAEKTNRLLFCDTTSLCTLVWHRRYLGNHSAKVEATSLARRPHLLTLFCEPDFPFVQDGTRDGEHIRSEMAEWLKESYTNAGRPFISLRGNHKDRMIQASQFIDDLLRAQDKHCE